MTWSKLFYEIGQTERRAQGRKAHSQQSQAAPHADKGGPGGQEPRDIKGPVLEHGWGRPSIVVTGVCPVQGSR